MNGWTAGSGGPCKAGRGDFSCCGYDPATETSYCRRSHYVDPDVPPSRWKKREQPITWAEEVALIHGDASAAEALIRETTT